MSSNATPDKDFKFTVSAVPITVTVGGNSVTPTITGSEAPYSVTVDGQDVVCPGPIVVKNAYGVEIDTFKISPCP